MREDGAYGLRPSFRFKGSPVMFWRTDIHGSESDMAGRGKSKLESGGSDAA